MNKRELYLLLLYLFISLISTAFNYPLARFPGQDLLWNDLVLAGRTLWAKDALLTNPFASVDFLQGLGDNVVYNVKVLPHFFDPAVFFSMIMKINLALALRNIFLIMYCLFCLEVIWRQQYGKTGKAESIKLPLFIFYVFSLQFFGEVGHHFSVVFYTIPGIICSLRFFIKKTSLISAFVFVAASALYINISDLHILFLAETLALFILLFDPVIKLKNNTKIFIAAIGFYSILLLSYLGAFTIFSGGQDLAVSKGTWDLSQYFFAFFWKAFLTIIFPNFPGPVTAYMAPYLPFFVLIFYKSDNKQLKNKLRWLWAMAAVLFILGLFMHGFELTRSNLPSAFRYHISILPFLCSLWLVFNANEIYEILIKKIKFGKIPYINFFLLVFMITALCLLGMKNKNFLVFFGTELEMPRMVLRIILFICLAVYPFTLILSMYINSKRKGSHISNGYVLSIVVLITTQCLVTTGIPNSSYVDFRLNKSLYEGLNKSINSYIEKSAYRDSPRSFLVISKGIHDSLRGWNDKMLPLIEIPEEVNGRAFFHWRYSYSKHTSNLYSKITKQGPINFFPPIPEQLDSVISFAYLTDSPFILSADSILFDERLELLGHINVKDKILDKYKKFQTGITGNIYLYCLKNFISASYKNIHYSRVSITLDGYEKNDFIIKLPISYFKDLEVFADKQTISVYKGKDGFAYINNKGNINSIWISSFSWITICSLFAPFIGFIAMAGCMAIARLFKMDV